ncbi:MAG: type II toxin-antitoxin system VapC family toxin [Terracidiphilus sp.]
MTIAAVADTHTALWHLFADPRLSSNAATFIDEAAKARRKIAISTISLAELVYLVEKGRLAESAYAELTQALADPEHVFAEAIFSFAIVEALRRVPRSEVPDLPDRIVAATAIHFGVPVISRDRRILASSLKTIWQAGNRHRKSRPRTEDKPVRFKYRIEPRLTAA